MRGIGGQTSSLDLRPYSVRVRVRTWTGSTPGKGTYSDSDTVFTNPTLPSGTTASVMVKQVNRKDVAASGGAFSEQAYKVGPLTPAYSSLYLGSGGYASSFEPSPTGLTTEVFWFATGPDLPASGAWFNKVWHHTTGLHTYVYLERIAVDVNRPLVSSVSPFVGGSGQLVTIAGSGLDLTTQVQFRSQSGQIFAAALVQPASAQTALCVAPSLPSGFYDVLVLGGGSTSTLPQAYADFSGVLLYGSNSTLVGQSTLSSWADSSGLGNNTNAFGSPSVNSSDPQYSGFPSLALNGTNQYLVTPSLTFGPFTVAMVCRMTATVGYFWQRASIDYLYGSTGVTTSVVRNSLISDWNISSNWGTTSAPITVITKYDGTHAGHTVRVNGVQQNMTNVIAQDPGVGVISAALGLFNDSVGGSLSSGTIAEFAVWNRNLSTAEIQSFEAYWRSKFHHY